MSDIGDTIRERRYAKNPIWSQAKLGGKIGVSQTLISQWERGIGEPDSDSLQELEKAFGPRIAAMPRWAEMLIMRSGCVVR